MSAEVWAWIDPSTYVCCPFSSKPVAITELSRVKDDCASVLLPPAVLFPPAVPLDAPTLALGAGWKCIVSASTGTFPISTRTAETLDAVADPEGAAALEGAATPDEAEVPADVELDPEVAPVAAMRAWTSDGVVQVMLVPALFTKGNAAQL